MKISAACEYFMNISFFDFFTRACGKTVFFLFFKIDAAMLARIKDRALGRL
jgi:hypothetical protein